MTLTFLIIGWLACGVLATICSAKKQGRLSILDGLLMLLLGPIMLFGILAMQLDRVNIWRRKADDQPGEGE